MEILQTGILIVAILGSIWQLMTIRKQVVTGGVVIPSYVMVVLCFSFCLLLLLFFHRSPFHLLWLSFVSLVIGFASLFFPPLLAVAMLFITAMSLTRRKSGGENQDPIILDLGAEGRHYSSPAKPSKRLNRRQKNNETR